MLLRKPYGLSHWPRRKIQLLIPDWRSMEILRSKSGSGRKTKESGKKLDMGKSWEHFKAEDLPLDLIAEIVAKVSQRLISKSIKNHGDH